MQTINLLQLLFRMDSIYKVNSQENATKQNVKSNQHPLKNLLHMEGENPKGSIHAHSVAQTDTVEFTSNDSGQLYHQQVSIPGNRSCSNISIKFAGKKKNNGEIDENHYHIVFSLQLQRLKETVMDVRVRNRVVTITIYNNSSNIADLVNQLQPSLKSDLEKHSYSLSTVKTVFFSNESTMTNQIKTTREVQSGVDFKV
ncbi:hypothetical protein [Fredinandcohnia sp. 179-A 10B2 NHS]|uniref:hypothetical protein n=1 Tax=Fredinandcohnia sp. 179-A 10B2 NHS TaxID=3235176 RepID=UPI0039A2C7D3